MATDLTVIIPTYKRVNRQFTLKNLPREWQRRTVLVANAEESKQFSRLHPQCRIWTVPSSIKTIAQKRKWIIEEAHEQGLEKIIMFDDDLRFARRVFEELPDDKFTFKLRKATDEDVDWALRKVSKMLDKFAHVGIGPRQGNNGLTKYRRWNPNYRMIYALGYRVPTIVKHCELGRIEHREDMDLCLQLLTKGFANRVLIEVVVDQTYNGPGGARDERTMERSNADADKLARWFPRFVKVVERDYKQSIKRREVTVAWKKAYAYGVERRSRRGA